ncbi:Uncharacterised protein [Vibrio cholerae]|nr:Uncharacterised protein [Vibrio cholerae]CSI67763.1 Uncharacterised protein [Vibrio cholerae]
MRVKSASQLANLFMYPPSDFKLQRQVDGMSGRS